MYPQIDISKWLYPQVFRFGWAQTEPVVATEEENCRHTAVWLSHAYSGITETLRTCFLSALYGTGVQLTFSESSDIAPLSLRLAI